MTSVTSRVRRGCCCVCVERRSDEDDIRLSPLPRRSPWRRQRTCITAGAACSPLSTAGAAGLYLFVNVSFFCIFNLYCIVVEIFNLIWIVLFVWKQAPEPQEPNLFCVYVEHATSCGQGATSHCPERIWRSWAHCTSWNWMHRDWWLPLANLHLVFEFDFFDFDTLEGCS